MTLPATTEKPSTSETATTDLDNSAHIAARQANAFTKNEDISATGSGEGKAAEAASGNESTSGRQGGGGGMMHSNEQSEIEKWAEKEYEERMEDEYAKREGGA
ncbi:MAG: hypothetical protein M1823_001638 [Watsoniomyces obsoletus]|nr:MAG: hypothetical protein M1823_001638 [Watsoniomyces obsoletus]